ncbi:MAG: hypothetical protein HQK82_03310 [Desulfovibrionaceae bacterium]|nr:hypothetical protein [Desulfovibrionaceae bacterium]
MSDRHPTDQTASDPDDSRMRDDIVKIRRFILKKEPTASQKELHKRRKKEISQYHNRLVQEDRDASHEAKKAYRDILVENEEIGYCDDLIGLIGMGERVASQDEEYLGFVDAENKLLAELAQVRRKIAQVRDLRDRLFSEFGVMAARLSGERARIDAVRRAPLDEPWPQAPAQKQKAAPVRTSRKKAAEPDLRSEPAEMVEPAEPAASAAPVSPPAPARAPKPETPPARDDLSSPADDILDLDASMIEDEPPGSTGSLKAETEPAAMSEDDIAALLDEKPSAAPAAKPAAKAGSQDDIDALLAQADGGGVSKPAAPNAAMSDEDIAALFDEKPDEKPDAKAGSQDDIDALLAQADGGGVSKPAAPNAAMSDEDIAALFDEKPDAKAGSQDDIDALLAQAENGGASKPAAPAGSGDPPGQVDDFNIDEELKFLDKK